MRHGCPKEEEVLKLHDLPLRGFGMSLISAAPPAHFRRDQPIVVGQSAQGRFCLKTGGGSRVTY